MTEGTGQIPYAVLIQDGEKLEYGGYYFSNARAGEYSKLLLKSALEQVQVHNLLVQATWLLESPISIPRDKKAGKTTFPTTVEDLKEKAGIVGKLTSGNQDQISWIVVASLQPVKPSNRSRTVDENSTLPTRGEVCAKGRKREPPSISARNHNLRETQSSANLGAIFNHCPLELSPPNITIFHPVFAKFIHLMNENSSNIVFTTDELDKACEFIVISTSLYPDERERQRALQNLKIVHVDFWRTATIPLGENESDSRCSIEELTNGVAESGCDAAYQADACYVSVCSGPDYHLIAASSCCPSFLVACEGTHISVAGAVFSDRFYTQKLTDYIFMGPMLGRQRGERSALDVAIREAAKLFRALKICLDDLNEFYANLTLPPGVSVAAKSRSASISNYRPASFPRMFPFWKSFAWNGHKYVLSYTSRLATQHHGKMVFRADMVRSDDGESRTRTVVVKFTPSYRRDAHILLAEHDPPLAPTLYHCEKIADVGDLYVVVMDYVVEDTDVDSTVVVQRVREAVGVLHSHNYVFGDLRQPNIIQTKDGMMLIDLDWVNIEGKARYPADISLDGGIPWHPEVKRGSLIKKEHDLYMITIF